MTLQEVVTQAAVVAPSYSRAVVIIWLLVTLALAQIAAIWILIQRNGGLDFLANVPITPLRSLVAIVLFPVAVIGSGVIGYASGVWIPEYIYDSTLLALTTWAGLEIGAVWLKRRTTDASIASRQNVQSGIAQGPAVSPPAQADQPIPANEVAVVAAAPAPNVPTGLPPRPDLGVPDRGVL